MSNLLRQSLNPEEQKVYDSFVETEKKPPESMAQLMQYSATISQQARNHTAFWSGIFGL